MEYYQSRRLRLITIGFGLILLGLLVFYIATHGRLSLSNQSGAMISVVKVRGNQTLEPLTDIKNGAFLSSGTYMVQNNSNGSQRVATVKVPGWLQEASITYQSTPTASIEKRAALTYENFFATEQGELLSFTDINDYLSGYTTHNPADAFGGRYTDIPLATDLYSPVVSAKGTIIGFSEQTVNEYSPSTKLYTPLLTLETEADTEISGSIRLQRSSNVESGTVGLYEEGSKKLTLLDASGKTQSYKDVDMGNTGVIYDVTDTAWVTVKNTRTAERSEKLKDEERKVPYVLTVFTRGSKAINTIDIGQATSVGAVALSTDGKHVAVEKDAQLWVYETSSGQVVMVNAFTNTNRLLWYKDKLYSLSTDRGISVFDTTSKQLLTVGLGGDDNLSFSNVIPIGTKLFFTAYSINQSSKLPNGYVLDLTGSAEKSSDELAKRLPYSTDQYDINYLGKTVYIRINLYSRSGDTPEFIARVEAVKKEAENQLKTLLSDETRKQIETVFTR